MKPINPWEPPIRAVVVNDDVTQITLLTGLLHKDGIEVLPFLDAEAALLAMVQNGAPDLIITDLYMPGLDGWRFCRLLRSPEYQPLNQTPILIISATFAGDEATSIAADLGADAFLTSPVDAGQFIKHVHTLLDGKSSHQQLRVLIVEDSKTLSDILKKEFAANGYWVESALTLQAAVAAFSKSHWDVAVIDYHLPDGNGDELLHDFRTIQPDCVCLMMTTDPAPELPLSWMKKGAAAYLRKPFAPEYLIELCVKTRRERALLRVQDLLEMRTQELQKSEERYRTLVEKSSDLVYKTDENGYFTFVNAVTPRITGYREDEIIGKHYKMLIRPDKFKEVITIFANQLMKKIPTKYIEFPILTKDGLEIWLGQNVQLITEDDQVKGFQGVAHDITERKQAEESLAFMNALLNAQLETSPNGILVVSNEGNIIFTNERFGEIWKIPKHILGKKNDKKVLEYASAQLKYPEGFIRKVEYPYQHHDEKNRDEIALLDGRYFERYSSSLISADGMSLGRIFFFSDITDKKRKIDEMKVHRGHLERKVKMRKEKLAEAMKNLKASKERYVYAMEASKDGLWDLNSKDKTIYCNHAFYRMLDYEPSDFGRDTLSHLVDLIHPEDRESVLAMIKQRLENEGFYEIEFRMRIKDGSHKWILNHGKVVTRDENGRPVRVIGTHTDLTVRKQMEIELRIANETQRAIFESANTGIALIRNSVILRCNHKTEKIFGYAPGELIDKTTRCWDDDDDAFADMGREIGERLTNKDIVKKECLLLRKDGTRFWARMTAQALHKGDISLGLVYIIEDITDERELNEYLRIAKDKAEMGSRAKDELIANVSHELRTPMTTIREGVSQVLEGILGPTTEAQRDFLSIVQKDTERLSRIINDLLDISKIEASRLEILKEPVDMIKIAKQVTMIFKPQADAKNLQIKTDFSESIIEAYVDSDKMLQVLNNLMNNALKFTKQGHIELSVKERNNLVVCTVKDTGEGIKTEDIPHIFDKFYQGARKNGPGEKGTGLGLPIARTIIEAHSGVFSVESVWGQGSIFTFEIPKVPL